MNIQRLYQQIAGSAEQGAADNTPTDERGFFSLYGKADYETRTYANLNNVKI